MANKILKVGTFVESSTVGVLQFQSVASKIGFLKNVNDRQLFWSESERMWFKTNEPIEKRINNKILGYVKHYIVEKKGHRLSDVKINWKAGTVSVQGAKIAMIAEGAVSYIGEAKEIQSEVDSAISKWKKKRDVE